MKKIMINIVLVLAMPLSWAQTAPTWDLYGSQQLDDKGVPQNISNQFTTKYPDQHHVTWHHYENGYIATYPDTSTKSTTGFIYDQSGTASGTAQWKKMSELPPVVASKLYSTYPELKSQGFYMVATPDQRKKYVINANGEWISFDENGIPVK